MAFTLPALPYATDALAPHISKETMEFHYGKHHAGYVTKLNALAKDDSQLASSSLESLLLNPKGKVYNLAAQVWNHTFYWQSMSPNGGGLPTGRLMQQITRDFGSYENFKTQFSAEALN